jgi:hypothetical protein
MLASIPWFVIFFAVIVASATGLALARQPNIDDVTCLLTLPIALRQSQYQVMAGPFQGSRRSSKTPHFHHHYQFYHHCLYCLPCQCRKKWNILTEIIVHKCNRIPPRSPVTVFHPHDVGQWSRELMGLEPQPEKKKVELQSWSWQIKIFRKLAELEFMV